jgi:hypothetical protein
MAWGIQGGRRQPHTAWAGRTGVACLQGIEGLGMAGPGESLGRLWIRAHTGLVKVKQISIKFKIVERLLLFPRIPNDLLTISQPIVGVFS